MFDRLKSALATAFPGPSVPTSDGGDFAVVPVHRGEWRGGERMGALDPTLGSTRPTLCPAPTLRSFDQEARITHLPASAQARHAASTNGYIAHGIEILQSVIVGTGLRPSVMPVAAELGWSDDAAREFGNAVERLFAEWANDPASCDATGRSTFGALQGQWLKSQILTGDGMALLDYGPKQNAAWRSSVALVDPIRIRTPGFQTYGVTVKDGIEIDSRGRPMAYWVREVNSPGQTKRIPTFLPNGTRMFLHVFDGDAGAIRGVSPIAAAIGSLLQSMSAVDAGILSAHISAMMVGTLTSDLPNEAIIRALGGDGADPLTRIMENRVAWHEGLKQSKADVDLGSARVVTLSTGERLDLHSVTKNFDAFDVILRHSLKEVAGALGVPYECLANDRSEASYASLKHATVEQRATAARKRAVLVEPFCAWALENVVQEAIAMRRLEFPTIGPYRRMSALDAFRELKRFALRSKWIGPAIADPDPLREARATQLRVQMGLSPLSDEIEATGKDAEETFDQIKRDRDALRARNLYLPQFEEGITRTGGTK